LTASGLAGSVTSLTETAFCTSANITPEPARKLMALRDSGSHFSTQSSPLTKNVGSSSSMNVCSRPRT
jgi:hypothetical protein